MSIPCKFERSLLGHDEYEIVAGTHHPAIYDADLKDLRSLLKRLRDLRDKERTHSRGKRREARGKGAPRGATFPGTAEHPYKRKQVFVSRSSASARRFPAGTSLRRVPLTSSLRITRLPCAVRHSSRLARPPDTPPMRECARCPANADAPKCSRPKSAVFRRRRATRRQGATLAIEITIGDLAPGAEAVVEGTRRHRRRRAVDRALT
jgi:hypothetical protein